MDRWSFHYLVSLGIAVTNTIALIAIFGFKSQDGNIPILPASWTGLLTETAIVIECLAQIGQVPQEQVTNQHSKFRQIFNLKAVHLLAFFILVYVGVEARTTRNSYIYILTACIEI